MREHRRPAAAGNPLLAVQAQVSQQIVDGLEAWRKASEKLAEDTFHAVYGTPALQAALGIDTDVAAPAAQGREEPAARGAGRAPDRRAQAAR